MTNPSNEQLVAFRYLQGNPHILQYLLDCRAKLFEVLATQKEFTDMRFTQGQIETISRLIKFITSDAK